MTRKVNVIAAILLADVAAIGQRRGSWRIRRYRRPWHGRIAPALPPTKHSQQTRQHQKPGSIAIAGRVRRNYTSGSLQATLSKLPNSLFLLSPPAYRSGSSDQR
jgi:hypothetical protein